MAKEKSDKPKRLGTKEVAAKLKVKAAVLRRWLRSKGKNTEGEYARYTWEPDSAGLTKLMEQFKKDQEEEASKPKEKKAKKTKGKAKKSKKEDEVAELTAA